MRRSKYANLTLPALGALAGTIAGVALLIGTIVIDVVLTHRTTTDALLRFIAGAAVGPVGATRPWAPALGLAIHLLVSAGWGAGFGRLAADSSHLLDRPFVSGAGFGFILYFAMQIVEVMAGVYRLPTPTTLMEAFFLHIACYGIPLAFMVSRGAARPE